MSLGDARVDERLRVVYVEDDVRLAALTARYFESHGVDMVVVPRGDEALAAVHRWRPGVIVLASGLPGLDGLEVCRALRERTDVPIIMVSGSSSEAERVAGLEAGADDHVAKPFSPRELLARVRARWRRARGSLGPSHGRITVGELVLDPQSMRATLGGVELLLSTYEWTLLRTLAERPGCVVSRAQLLDLMHGRSTDHMERSVDVTVSRLRQKLGDDPRNPVRLKTVRGIGYVLVTPD